MARKQRHASALTLMILSIAAFAGESVIISDRNQRCLDVMNREITAWDIPKKDARPLKP